MVIDAVDQLTLRSTILDGEIVALDEEGIPRFQLLQQNGRNTRLLRSSSTFDVLWSSGRDPAG